MPSPCCDACLQANLCRRDGVKARHRVQQTVSATRHVHGEPRSHHRGIAV
ncbi:hypothetical protein ACFONI_02870 [Aeromonas media]